MNDPPRHRSPSLFQSSYNRWIQHQYRMYMHHWMSSWLSIAGCQKEKRSHKARSEWRWNMTTSISRAVNTEAPLRSWVRWDNRYAQGRPGKTSFLIVVTLEAGRWRMMANNSYQNVYVSILMVCSRGQICGLRKMPHRKSFVTLCCSLQIPKKSTTASSLNFIDKWSLKYPRNIIV